MAKWFVMINDKEHGPFQDSQLKKLVAEGRLGPEDLIRREDRSSARRAGEVKGLFPDTDSPKAPTPPAPIVAEPSATNSQVSLLHRTPTIALLLTFCFPVGLVLIWTHPRWSNGQKWTWTGTVAAVFVSLSMIGQINVQRAKDDLVIAHKSWDAGDKPAAVSKYRSLLKEDLHVLSNSDKSLVYGRVIDFDAETGNMTSVEALIEEASRNGVVPSVSTEQAKSAISATGQERQTGDEVAASTIARTMKQPISLANGRLSLNQFLDYLKWDQSKFKLHTSEKGTDVSGTEFEFLNGLLGEPCRIHVGGRENFGQNVSVIIVEVADRQVAAVILGTPLDLSQPIKWGNDVASLGDFMRSMLPESSIRTIIKEQSRSIALGGQAQESFGKASLIVRYNKTAKELTATIVVAK